MRALLLLLLVSCVPAHVTIDSDGSVRASGHVRVDFGVSSVGSHTARRVTIHEKQGR